MLFPVPRHPGAHEPAAARAQGRRPGGYSTIELMVVVTIIAIVATFVVPNLASSTRTLRLESAAQQLIGDLNRAKVEALKRNESVSLTKINTTEYKLADSEGVTLDTRELPEGVTFGSGSPATVTFASFGPNTTASTYYLLLNNDTVKVVLSGAGYAGVKP